MNQRSRAYGNDPPLMTVKPQRTGSFSTRTHTHATQGDGDGERKKEINVRVKSESQNTLYTSQTEAEKLIFKAVYLVSEYLLAQK